MAIPLAWQWMLNGRSDHEEELKGGHGSLREEFSIVQGPAALAPRQRLHSKKGSDAHHAGFLEVCAISFVLHEA